MEENSPTKVNLNLPKNDEFAGRALCGDPCVDAEVICGWFASSYGQTSQCYHEAYNTELFKQAIMMKNEKNDSLL